MIANKIICICKYDRFGYYINKPITVGKIYDVIEEDSKYWTIVPDHSKMETFILGKYLKYDTINVHKMDGSFRLATLCEIRNDKLKEIING